MIRFQVDPDQKFSKAVQEAASQVSDLRIPLGLIATSWFQSNKAIFALSGPGQYQDLSSKPFFAWWERGDLRRRFAGGYKEFKNAVLGFTYPIFRGKTGALEASITNKNAPGAIATIANQNTVILGTSIPYAIYHQSSAPRKKIPFRPIVMIGSEQTAPPELNQRREIWIEILKNYVLQVSKKIGQVPQGSA